MDEDQQNVSAAAVFRGTNTGQGPVPPTGKAITSDYVYVLHFDGDKIKAISKIWNDVYALKQLGWA